MRYTTIITLALFCCANALQAQTRQRLDIQEATIFLRGAQLTSTAHVQLKKGENEFIFSNVAGDVNAQSLSVGASNGVVVESATFRNDYLVTDNITPRTKELKDSIEDVTDLRGTIAARVAVLTEQISVLQNNRKVSGDNNGLAVAELSKMLDLINTRMEGYLNQKRRQEVLLAKADERLANMNNQLDEERKKDVQPGGQLLVKFYAPQAMGSAVAISYTIPNAGWIASYDIRVEDITKPVSLFYKASVFQNSGVKWTNVKLSLSTGNPQEGVEAPTMNPWYLALYIPPAPEKRLVDGGRKHTMAKEETGVAPTTELTDLAALSPGLYQSQRGKGVNIDGARANGSLYIIDGVQVQNLGMNDYVNTSNNGISTTFNIDLPYTIPNDGQRHMVDIKKYDLPATYRYYAAPKLDNDAFLQAQLTNWEDMDLLPGQSNIFYQGTYVGQGYLNMRNVTDTMIVSLGRDKKIVIKREQDKKRRSVKQIGSSVRETFAYTITVRNTRKAPVTLVLQDQVPVSNDKDIIIEDVNTADAAVDEATGAAKWLLGLGANESKSVQLGYTIKYPKGKTVTGMQ